MVNKDTVEFLGRKYTRYPDSKSYSAQRYFRSGRKAHLLHRDKYTHHHGPIPDGHVIHHVDHDPLNNDISNLRSMPRAEHSGHHLDGVGLLSPENRLKSHVASKKAWKDMATTTCQCNRCGKDYEVKQTMVDRSMYCSAACKAAAYRARKSA